MSVKHSSDNFIVECLLKINRIPITGTPTTFIWVSSANIKPKISPAQQP